MNIYAMEILEYKKVVEKIQQHAVSQPAKNKIEKLLPTTDLVLIKRWMNETTEARSILEVNSSVPLTALENMDGTVGTIEGRIMSPDELTSVKGLLLCVKRLRKFMDSMQTIGPTIASYSSSMFELPHLYEEIDRCISNGRVDDRATPELNRLRRKMAVTDDRIKEKLNSILSSASYSVFLQEALITTRGGRFTVPVKKEYRKNIAGHVVDVSSSGSTLFIEPAAVAALQEELDILKMQEEKEILRILSMLTKMVDDSSREISINIEAIVHYDIIFARAKYSKSLDCSPVTLNTRNFVNIKAGRHPLVESAVPLDFHLGDGYRALIITGPNTGGKTVALKTVGLLTLMAQSGLHVPVQAGSDFAVFNDILVDIGDGQSIEQSLSTFSSHVKNISTIITYSNPNSLVIMDEIGAGTEPGEGMGFAVAVLEEVFNRGASIIATTHISDIKEYAEQHDGFQNGCMAFDIKSLKPLYQLRIGQAGESNAFLIALRLGIDRRIIERAHEITYREKRDYSGEAALNWEQTVDEESRGVYDIPGPERQIDLSITANNSVHKIDKRFKKGDCVFISTMKRTGIVYEPENNRGEVTVMVMKKKYKINHKRLSLYVDAEDLYPEDYDLDIVFESKENRKKRKQFSKHHLEGVYIEIPKEDE